MKFSKLVIVFFAIAFTVAAQAPPTADLSGSWKISWYQNGKEGGKPNIVSGAETKGEYNGIYEADNGELCQVTGTDINRNISLTVQCKEFKIWMNGRFTDDNVVGGNYIAPKFSNGSFVMDRRLCLLPEGCKQ